LQTPTQTYKLLDSDIPTTKDRLCRNTNQQRKRLGITNTNPGMQTNRFRYKNRERQAL
jgi:hypothetical protein